MKFEVGKVYDVYLKTGGIRKFVCTGEDETTARGTYDGGKEKGYKVEPSWRTIDDKNKGLSPYEYTIKINDRNGVLCCSRDVEGAN